MIQAREVCKKHRKKLFKKKGVTSVGVGFKYKDGRKTEEVCVIVGVEKKQSASFVRGKDMIPYDLDGVRTDVVETGKIKALRTEKFRPAPGGVSIGHYQITAGTFGCIVKDVSSNNVFILSNNHVLANSNEANQGDLILQPGPHDGGTRNDRIGTLINWVPINFGGEVDGGTDFISILKQFLCQWFGLFCDEQPTEPNTVDAAIALPDDESVVNEIIEIGKPTGAAKVELGQSVQKSGRTTGYTVGEVIQVDTTVQVQYGPGKIATFENQFVTDAVSAGGDSGSVFLDSSNRVVGLLFAGGNGVTIFNPIKDVLDKLSVAIYVD